MKKFKNIVLKTQPTRYDESDFRESRNDLAVI